MDVEHGVPPVLVDLDEGTPFRKPGAGDQDGDGPQFRANAAECLLDLRRPRDVRAQRERGRFLPPAKFGGLVRSGAIPIQNRHGVSTSGESDGNRTADPRSPAGYQRHPPCIPVSHDGPMLSRADPSVKTAWSAIRCRAVPADRFLVLNRLRHHLLDWGGDGLPVVLLHGFLEHAHAWDFVAPRLRDAGLRPLALDWRGHGDSDRVGAGGYYHFADYVADLAFLVRALGGRVALVGHSMGGGAAVLYAGTEPDRVAALVCIEGIGIPTPDPEEVPDRYAGWIADLLRCENRPARRFSLDDAAARLRERFPRFSESVARHMAFWGTREVEGDLRTWKFDPLHQTRAPQPTAAAFAFARRVKCPVLYVEGTESDFRLDNEELQRRLSMLRARRVTLDGTGHHPHLECPEELAPLLIEFLLPICRS